MERDEWQRAAWKAMVAQPLDAHSLVFVDEMGTSISLSPLYGWAKKAHASISAKHQGLGDPTTEMVLKLGGRRKG
jgi:hypothetical protein